MRCSIAPSEVGRLTLGEIDAILKVADGGVVPLRDEQALLRHLEEFGGKIRTYGAPQN